MDGLVYLLNQSGLALAQANERIEALSAEIERLREESSESVSNGHHLPED